jgi:hypothetical protein
VELGDNDRLDLDEGHPEPPPRAAPSLNTGSGRFVFADAPQGHRFGVRVELHPTGSQGEAGNLLAPPHKISDPPDLFHGWIRIGRSRMSKAMTFVVWAHTHTPEASWPKGYKLLGDKLYFEERLCLPEDL